MATLSKIEVNDLQANPDTNDIEASVKSEQDAHKESNPKCLQVKPVKEGDVVKEVHEYVCPDGKVGWQAYVRASVKGKEMVKSFGEGPESEARSHDWQEVLEDEL